MEDAISSSTTEPSSFLMGRVQALLSQQMYYYSHILTDEKREPSLGIDILDLYRDRLCQWLYSVVDYYNFDRDVVALTINIIERYCHSSKCFIGAMKPRDLLVDEKIDDVKPTIQLVTLSSLYIILKVSCPETIEFDSFLLLGRSQFTKEQLVTTEMTILDAIEWKISIPTPKVFTCHFLVLFRKVVFPTTSTEEEPQPSRKILKLIHDIKCTSYFLGELSICDSYYNEEGILPSTIAAASVLYALRLSNIPQSLIYKTQTLIFQAIGMETECKNELDMCITRLCDSYSTGNYESKGSFSRESSPTHVSEGYFSD
jgi:hypothetical protein